MPDKVKETTKNKTVIGKLDFLPMKRFLNSFTFEISINITNDKRKTDVKINTGSETNLFSSKTLLKEKSAEKMLKITAKILRIFILYLVFSGLL